MTAKTTLEGIAAPPEGLLPGEGAFLACSFWLVDAYVLQKRWSDAGRLFDRLVGLSNDVGLLSKEYDARSGRLVGNFPQAFTHVALINSARNPGRAARGADRSAGFGVGAGFAAAERSTFDLIDENRIRSAKMEVLSYG